MKHETQLPTAYDNSSMEEFVFFLVLHVGSTIELFNLELRGQSQKFAQGIEKIK